MSTSTTQKLLQAAAPQIVTATTKRLPMYKSPAYRNMYERPMVCEALAKIQGKFDWDAFAQVMKEEDVEVRKKELGNLYDNGLLVALRSAFLSQMQKARVHSGRLLEQQVSEALKSLKVPFSSQVAVLDNKIISKRVKGCNILDFVVPSAKVGDSLEKYTLLSTKTSTRERGTMDHKHKCKSVFWVTHDKTNEESPNHIVIPRDEDAGNEVNNLISALQFLAVDEVTPKKTRATKKKLVTEPTECIV